MVQNNKINIPIGAKIIIDTLAAAGFEAYVVGGCVRDSLLGLKPHDWDICTSATPDEVMRCFQGLKIIGTGLKHGTVTIMDGYVGYEVTTFRTDSTYSDNRHPDSVRFTLSLEEDLARRDFAMNAMAYSDSTGLIDPFGGQEALKRRQVTCVGAPQDRFGEDALRILRALRFSATYDFDIEAKTGEAIHELSSRLKYISKERICSELCRLLLGPGVLRILLEYSDVITTIIPELTPCVGFEQKNRYHQYTVYDHIAHAVANYTGQDLSVKVALLLHDIGKPKCYTEDEKGGHFYGHAVPSHEISKGVLTRLRFDGQTRREVLDLVLYHDAVIEPTPKTVRRWLGKIGEARFRQLLDVRMADIKAHREDTQASRIERCQSLRTILNEVIAQEQCFSLKHLAISGKDILALGVPQGKQIGEVLNKILDEVIAGELVNERPVLLERAKSIARDVRDAEEREWWRQYEAYKDFQREVYRRYQLDWMLNHGMSVAEVGEGVAEEVFDMCQDEQQEATPSWVFKQWMRNFRSGEIFADFDDFLKNEYMDKVYVKKLLPAKIFSQYLKQIKRWGK